MALSFSNYTFVGHTSPLGVVEAMPCSRCQERRGIILLLLIHQRAMRHPPSFFCFCFFFLFKGPKLSNPVAKEFNFKYISKEIRFQGYLLDYYADRFQNTCKCISYILAHFFFFLTHLIWILSRSTVSFRNFNSWA